MKRKYFNSNAITQSNQSWYLPFWCILSDLKYALIFMIWLEAPIANNMRFVICQYILLYKLFVQPNSSAVQLWTCPSYGWRSNQPGLESCKAHQEPPGWFLLWRAITMMVDKFDWSLHCSFWSRSSLAKAQHIFHNFFFLQYHATIWVKFTARILSIIWKSFHPGEILSFWFMKSWIVLFGLEIMTFHQGAALNIWFM